MLQRKPVSRYELAHIRQVSTVGELMVRRTAIGSPSKSLAINFSRSSMGLHAFQGILRSLQKAPLCNPCLRNELSPLSQEGHNAFYDFGAPTPCRTMSQLFPSCFNEL